MLIVGTGAVASWLSHRLTQVGVALQHFGSPSRRLQTLSQNTVGYPLRACTKASEVVGHELWIVVTKAGQNLEKIRALQDAPRPNSILVLQNGLAPEAEWHALGTDVERGLLTYGVASTGPGRYRGGKRGEIVLCASSGFSQILHRAGIKVRQSPEFSRELWLKLAVNASLNVVCSLDSLTNGLAWERVSSRKLIVAAANEVATLAQHHDVEITDEQATRVVELVAAQTSSNVCSTLSDLRNGRPSEYQYINGALLDRAKDLGCEVPVLMNLDQRFRRLERVAPGLSSWVPIPNLRALRLTKEPSPLPVFQGLDLRLREAQA